MLPGHVVTMNDVHDPETFAKYIQQTLGCPWPRAKDMVVLRKKIKDFFERYPHCDYDTLCKVVNWCKGRKRRFAHVYSVVDQFRYAYQAGYLPEVDESVRLDSQVEEGIREALSMETDDTWRTRLMCSEGSTLRKEVLVNWIEKRKPVLAA